MADLEKVRTLAKDLTKAYPRSPREMLGGYVFGARCADKCRAFLLGINGEYNYWPCSLAGLLFAFTGITPDQFKEIVATGATDEELGAWINVHSKVQDRQAVIEWNNKMRDLRLSEMAPAVQAYMEDYIPKYVPTHRPFRKLRGNAERGGLRARAHDHFTLALVITCRVPRLAFHACYLPARLLAVGHQFEQARIEVVQVLA